MNPLVSIIIPCYNAGAFLEETLASVQQQSYAPLEVILVNDGSTDNSVEIAEKFKDLLDLQILSIPNGGVSNARNIGFQRSKGEYLVFLDADDLLKPAFLAEKIKLIQESGANSCGSLIEHFKVNTQEEKVVMQQLISITTDFQQAILEFEHGKSTVPSAYLFHRSLIGNSTPFNVCLSSTADRYFLLEYAKQFNMVSDNNPNSCLLYRETATSMSHHFTEKLVDDNAMFYDEVHKNLTITKKQLKSGYWMLAKSYFKVKAVRKGMRYLWRCV